MFSSTPQPHRQPAPALSSPESSQVRRLEDNCGSERDSTSTVSSTGRTGLSRDTEQIQVDIDSLPEALVEQLAKQVVAVESFNVAKNDFQHRISMDPRLLEMVTANAMNGDDEIKFRHNESDTISFEVSDILIGDEDMDLVRLFCENSHSQHETNGKVDMQDVVPVVDAFDYDIQCLCLENLTQDVDLIFGDIMTCIGSMSQQRTYLGKP